MVFLSTPIFITENFWRILYLTDKYLYTLQLFGKTNVQYLFFWNKQRKELVNERSRSMCGALCL